MKAALGLCAIVVSAAFGQAYGQTAPRPWDSTNFPRMASSYNSDAGVVVISDDAMNYPGICQPYSECPPCPPCMPTPEVCVSPMVCCAPSRPACFIFGEAIFLRATGGDVAHAQQQNGIGGAGTTPFGDIGVVDHDFSTGYRFGGGFGLDACSDITVTYVDFETSGSNQLLPPTIPRGGGSVGSLVQHPGAALTASAGPVDASQSTDFLIADVLYRRVLYRKCSGGLNWLAGAQYGTLDQGFSQTGVFSGGAGGAIDTATNISFDGAGLKAGLDGEQLMCRRISVYGRLTAAVMSGQFQSNYTMQNSTTDVLLAQSNWSENRVVPQIEYELGLKWTSCNNHWRARAGYLVSHWSNAVTSPTFIDAVQANNYTGVEDTITFDGAVGRIEFIW